MISGYTAFAFTADTLTPTASGLDHVVTMPFVHVADDPGNVATQLLTMPIGKRVIVLSDFHTLLLGHTEDRCKDADGDFVDFISPWFPTGTAAVQAWLVPLLQAVKDAGATIDFVVTDIEQAGFNLSDFVISVTGGNPQYEAIAADPRFAEGSPSARALYDGVVVDREVPPGSDLEAKRWNAVMTHLLGQALRAAIYDSLVSVFPDAGYSQFGGDDSGAYIIAPESDPLVDYNGWETIGYDVPGTHQSPATYTNLGGVVFYPLGRPPHSREVGTPVWTNPMATLGWQISNMRALVRASSVPILPWVQYRAYKDIRFNEVLHDTDYYQELLYHLLLTCGTTNFLYFNPPTDALSTAKGAGDDGVMSDLLAEYQWLARSATSVRPLTKTTVLFDASALVSGALCVGPAGHWRVYRITFAPGVDSADLTLPDELQARTFVRPAGAIGLWFVEQGIGMAREITMLQQLTVSKGALSISRKIPTTIDMTGNRSSEGAFSVAAGSEGVAIPVGDLSTAGVYSLLNTDATNYIEIGIQVAGTFYPFGKLKPGESMQGRLGTNAPYARAHTAACVLEFHIVED